MIPFTLGADPEAIVVNHSGFPVSAIGRLPGFKHDPFEMESGTCHPDNVMAEFNTAVAKNIKEFSTIITSCIQDVNSLLKAKGCYLEKGMVALYPKPELQHPEALTAGCSPDFNAYHHGGENTPPNFETNNNRCAGGHIHIGADITDIHKFIQACDLFLTIPTLSEESLLRRSLYGQAGSFRVKPYGVEYRTIGNHWIWSTERHNWVWNQVQYILDHYETLVLPDYLAEIINNHDLDTAKQLCQDFKIPNYPN